MIELIAGLAIGLGLGLAIMAFKLRESDLRHKINLREEADNTKLQLARREAALQQDQEQLQSERAAMLGYSHDELWALLRSEVEEDVVQNLSAQALARCEDVEQTAAARSRNLLLTTLGRQCSSVLNEAATCVVSLPSEDMKGRVIGRDGRNVRAFEQAAGVDLLIDETPSSVTIACFDPGRREIARLALQTLLADGRIHPARIEEVVAQTQGHLEETKLLWADEALRTLQLPQMPLPVRQALGNLRLRMSFGQNVLQHSIEVAQIAEHLGAELGLNTHVLRTAGLLHDIGKALGEDYPGAHAGAGMTFLRAQGLAQPICHAVGAHHEEIPFETDEARVVALADRLSASRPGARRDSVQVFLKRMADLEALAKSFPNVIRSYALQSGREIWVFVCPERSSDAEARALARKISKKIEKSIEYSGQIKVTIVRESRFTEVAT